MNWQDTIVRRTLEGAGEYPSVQLQFLLSRLENYPEAVPAIAAAIDDMGKWYLEHAKEIEAEGARCHARAKLREIVNNPK